MKKIKEIGCLVLAAIMTLLTAVIIVDNKSVDADVNRSIIDDQRYNLLSSKILRATEGKLTKGRIDCVQGRTYKIEVSDYGGKTKLGTVIMKTKVYYSGTSVNNTCSAYVEGKIEVHPNVFAYKSGGGIKQVGLPNYVAIDGKYKLNADQVAYPKKEGKVYQMSATKETQYSLSGSLNLGWSSKDGFGINGGGSGSITNVSSTSISYPAALIIYGVNNRTGAEGYAHWENDFDLDYISKRDDRTKKEMVNEIWSTTYLYSGLSGKLNTYVCTVTDYCASGYKKEKLPGTVYISWDQSDVKLSIGASFGSYNAETKKVYGIDSGSVNSGKLRVK